MAMARFSVVGITLDFGNFQIQMTVIVYVDHPAMNHFFQLLKIDHKAGDRVHFSLYRDFQGVVVAMALSIRTLAEKTKVFLL